MDSYLYIALLAGTVLMFLVMCVCRKYYAIPLLKLAITAPILTSVGFLGTKLMFFFENGSWTGLSFYGAVFFIPIVFFLYSKVIRLQYGVLMDISAPSICAMLALIKVNCMISGCCGGRTLFHTSQRVAVVFPSREVEMIVAIIIMVFLLVSISRKKHVGMIFPLFLIAYGASRFILNCFRDTEPFLWFIPAGNLWSMVAAIIGVFVLRSWNRKRRLIEEKPDSV